MLEIFDMANNGYLISGVCSSSSDYLNSVYCPQKNPSWYYSRIEFSSAATNKPYFVCGSSSSQSYLLSPAFNCEIPGPIPPSTIPTVADGISLGWQAGAALILVGCILFLKKALK